MSTFLDEKKRLIERAGFDGTVDEFEALMGPTEHFDYVGPDHAPTAG